MLLDFGAQVSEVMFVQNHHLSCPLRVRRAPAAGRSAAHARRRLAWLLSLAGMLLTLGCVGNRATGLARHYHLTPEVATGGKFQHQLFLNNRPGPYLHVYLEGDGKAWLSPRRISPDPTPDNPMMLELMPLDPAPSMYLGRPCYFTRRDAQCGPLWWTDRRYSEEVVDSLGLVLDQFAPAYRGVVLFGHSGGGTLAMLLAGRRQDVVMVVTLAGNLDIDAWAALHDYTPLSGSLNPYRQAPLGREIRQVHFIGAEDSIVTVDLLKQALAPQRFYDLQVVPGIDHACCWRALWPKILAEVDQVAIP